MAKKLTMDEEQLRALIDARIDARMAGALARERARTVRLLELRGKVEKLKSADLDILSMHFESVHGDRLKSWHALVAELLAFAEAEAGLSPPKR